MNLRVLFKKYFGWCPGVNSASKFSSETSSRDNILGILGLLILLVIPFSPLDGIYRFILMVFSAFVGIPICWRLIRGEKAGPQDGTYPDRSEKPLPHEEFGEFNLNSPIEAPVFGPSRSTGGFDAEMMISREWLHPDILWYKKRYLQTRKKKKDELTEYL